MALLIGFMNFSIIYKKNNAYKETRKSYEDYKSSILNSDRLDLRSRIFFDHTVPIIINQSKRQFERGVHVRLCVGISALLPEGIKEKFYKLQHEYVGIFSIYEVDVEVAHSWEDVLDREVFEYTSNIDMNESQNLVVSNFRLDDDDILLNEYFESHIKYLTDCFSGFYLTFPKGYLGVYESGYTSFYEVNKPFLAIGLSKVSSYSLSDKKFLTENPCILGGVSHTRIINDAVAVLDSSDSSYIWTMHEFSDTRSVDKNLKASRAKIERFISESNLSIADFSSVMKRINQPVDPLV